MVNIAIVTGRDCGDAMASTCKVLLSNIDPIIDAPFNHIPADKNKHSVQTLLLTPVRLPHPSSADKRTQMDRHFHGLCADVHLMDIHSLFMLSI